MPTLSRATAITGIGETDYTRGSPYSSKALNLQAASRAIEDAGLRPGDIDGVIPNSLASGPTAEDLIEGLGIADLRYSVTVQMGGASPIASIQNAAMAVACGVARNVLVVAGWNGYSGPRISQMEAKRGQSPPSAAMLTTAEFEVPFGLLVPMQWFALLARHHMCQYGTTSKQLGAVAVAERKHAMLNPKAIMKHPLTLEDHQASPMLAEPFRLLDCCLESDGATAVVVSAAETANDLKQRPVYIMGIAEGHPDSPSSIPTRRDLERIGCAKAAPKAFGMAGLSPADIKLAEIYDCFTFVVVLQLENLGFCDRGEGGPFVEGGRIELGGALPINTHGGLLSQAHSMSGLNHVAEAVKQLRGTAGPAQVDSPEPCLVSGYGDFGDGAVLILGR